MTDDVSVCAARLAAELEIGIAEASDPDNAAAMNEGGTAVTGLRSRWLHLRCEGCGHTFRLGDEVSISDDGRVRHCSATLPCAENAPEAESLAEDQMSAFFSGLEETWPPPPNLPIVRLAENHLLLAPPESGFRRRACAVCGHTFRPHDHVVICPCRPDRPLCIVAIHRDPVHGLNCWQEWNPGQYRLQCPATSRSIDG